LKNIVCLLIVSFFISSCIKNKEVEILTSEIYFEINGVPYQFQSKTAITFSFVGGIQTLGEEIPTRFLHLKTPNLEIQIKDFTPVNAGNYAGKIVDNEGNIKGVNLWYFNEIENYESTFSNPDTEVTITSINRKGVQGTFRGTVLNVGGQDTLKLENGSFSIYSTKFKLDF